MQCACVSNINVLKGHADKPMMIMKNGAKIIKQNQLPVLDAIGPMDPDTHRFRAIGKSRQLKINIYSG